MSQLADIYAAVRLQLDGTGFEAQATALADKSGKNVGDRLSANLSASLKAAGTGVLLGAGMQAFNDAEQLVKNLIGGSAEAYRTNQASLALLTQALANNVKGWDGDTSAVEANIQKNIEYGFTVAEQRDSMGKLVGVTKDVSFAMQVETAAMDLARVKHVDLATATTAMVMAMGGNLRGLKAIGVQLKAGATQTEVLTAVMKIAGGQMEIYANTDAGKMAAAQERVNEDMVKLGGAISTVTTAALPVLVEGLTAVVDGLGDLANNAEIVVPLAGLIVAAWVSGLDALTSGFAAALVAGIKGSAVVAVPAATAEGVAIGEAVVAGETRAIAAGAPVVAGGVAASSGEAVVAGGAVGTAIGGAISAAAALAIPVLVVVAVAMLADAIEPTLHKLGNDIHNAIFQSQGDSPALASDLPWPLGPKGTPDLSIGPMEHILGGDSIPVAAKNVADKITKPFAQSAFDLKLLAAGIPQAIVDQLDAGGFTLEMGADGAFKAVPIALTNAQLAADAIAAGAPRSIADQIAAGAGTLSVAADGTFSVIPNAMAAAQLSAGQLLAKGIKDQISKIKGSRSALSSAWSDAIDASGRSQEIGYEKEANLAEQAAIQAANAEKRKGKRLTAAQKEANNERLLALQEAYAKLLVEDATYGTKAEQIAKLNGLLQSKALLDGLGSTDPGVVTMWTEVQAETLTQLDLLNGTMDTGGTNAAAALIAAFDATIKNGTWAVSLLSGLTLTTAVATPPISSGGSSGGSSSGGSPGPKKLDVGMPFVAHDQLAYIHQAEAVLTKPQAEEWRAGRGGGPRTIIQNFGGTPDRHTAIDMLRAVHLRDQIGWSGS